MELLRHHALLMRVPDLESGIQFYAGRFGLVPERLAPSLARLEGGGARLYVEQVAPAPGPASDQARAFASFPVPDIEALSLAEDEIDPLTRTPRPIQGGWCVRVRDPFGNVQTVMEPREPETGQVGFGIKMPIASIPAARRLYGDFLCFVTGERTYPPRLTMSHRDGTLAFTIEDKEIWEPDVRVRAPLYPAETGAVMVFSFFDLESLRGNLVRRATRLTEIAGFPLGRRMAVFDAAGLASEIWQFA